MISQNIFSPATFEGVKKTSNHDRAEEIGMRILEMTLDSFPKPFEEFSVVRNIIRFMSSLKEKLGDSANGTIFENILKLVAKMTGFNPKVIEKLIQKELKFPLNIQINDKTMRIVGKTQRDMLIENMRFEVMMKERIASLILLFPLVMFSRDDFLKRFQFSVDCASHLFHEVINTLINVGLIHMIEVKDCTVYKDIYVKESRRFSLRSLHKFSIEQSEYMKTFYLGGGDKTLFDQLETLDFKDYETSCYLEAIPNIVNIFTMAILQTPKIEINISNLNMLKNLRVLQEINSNIQTLRNRRILLETNMNEQIIIKNIKFEEYESYLPLYNIRNAKELEFIQTVIFEKITRKSALNRSLKDIRRRVIIRHPVKRKADNTVIKEENNDIFDRQDYNSFQELMSNSIELKVPKDEVEEVKVETDYSLLKQLLNAPRKTPK